MRSCGDSVHAHPPSRSPEHGSCTMRPKKGAEAPENLLILQQQAGGLVAAAAEKTDREVVIRTERGGGIGEIDEQIPPRGIGIED